MLIRRSELRLALTAGLMNGLGSLAPLAYGFYAPMAVLVVCTGTYGGSIGLGRQRLLGSLVGGGWCWWSPSPASVTCPCPWG